MSRNDFSPQIAVVGAANAGKTTLVRTLMKRDDVGKTRPTIGFDMKKIHYKGIEFLVTDLGGQKPFVQAFWDKILPKTDGVIFLIDAAAPNNFILAYDLFLYVLKKMTNVPMVVLANKQDLPDAASVSSLEKIFNFEKARLRFGITALHIAPISALLGDGVTDALDWLCNQIVLNAGYTIPLILDIFIYHRPTGRPLAVIQGKSLEKIISDGVSDTSKSLTDDEKRIRDLNPTLISAFYSALSSFSQEITSSSIQSLKLRNSNPMRADHLLFNYMDENSPLSCLIIATHGDNELLLEFIATRLIDHVKNYHSWMLEDDVGAAQKIVDLTEESKKLISTLIRNETHSKEKEENESYDILWAKDLLVDDLNDMNEPVVSSISSENQENKESEGLVEARTTELVEARTTTESEDDDLTREEKQPLPDSDYLQDPRISNTLVRKDPDKTLNERNFTTKTDESTESRRDDEKQRDFHQLSVQERILELEKRRKRKNQ